jgi:hypothetical protein
MSDTDNRQKQKLEADQWKADWQTVMATPAGRRLLGGIMNRCGIYNGGHIGNAEIHYRAGRRDVGLEMMADMTAFCHEKYIEMLQEARAK